LSSAKKEALLLAVLALAGIVAPQWLYPVFLMKVMCFAIFTCAYNLLFGYGGLLAFGHAAFFGAAAYATAQAIKVWGFSAGPGILLGVVVAAFLGVVIGWVAIRRQGLYFAMITLALAQIVYFYVARAPWAHGEDGLQNVPRGELLGLYLDDPQTLYGFVMIVFLAAFALVMRAIHSPFGQALKAVRENEPRAISLGYKVEHLKLMAFVLSAALSGLAGSMKTLVFQLASLHDVSFYTSGDVLLAVLMGGIGTLLGPVAGALALVTMQDYLALLGPWVLIVQGALFVLFTLLLRKGLVGTGAAWLRRARALWRSKAQPKAA
jgi:branched-chain amino acid transport system permease protein